jgi:hypothetical protein
VRLSMMGDMLILLSNEGAPPCRNRWNAPHKHPAANPGTRAN